jgi:hypothetical protein
VDGNLEGLMLEDWFWLLEGVWKMRDRLVAKREMRLSAKLDMTGE